MTLHKRSERYGWPPRALLLFQSAYDFNPPDAGRRLPRAPFYLYQYYIYHIYIYIIYIVWRGRQRRRRRHLHMHGANHTHTYWATTLRVIIECLYIGEIPLDDAAALHTAPISYLINVLLYNTQDGSCSHTIGKRKARWDRFRYIRLGRWHFSRSDRVKCISIEIFLFIYFKFYWPVWRRVCCWTWLSCLKRRSQ